MSRPRSTNWEVQTLTMRCEPLYINLQHKIINCKTRGARKRKQNHSLLDKKHCSCCSLEFEWTQPELWVLTIHEHFELLVVELGLLLRDQGALGALPHGVHEAHARQRHFLTAALVTETLPTPSAVMLKAREYLFTKETKRLLQVSQVWNVQAEGQVEEMNCYRNLWRLDTKDWV